MALKRYQTPASRLNNAPLNAGLLVLLTEPAMRALFYGRVHTLSRIALRGRCLSLMAQVAPETWQ
jgi:hypothetical protein